MLFHYWASLSFSVYFQEETFLSEGYSGLEYDYRVSLNFTTLLEIMRKCLSITMFSNWNPILNVGSIPWQCPWGINTAPSPWRVVQSFLIAQNVEDRAAEEDLSSLTYLFPDSGIHTEIKTVFFGGWNLHWNTGPVLWPIWVIPFLQSVRRNKHIFSYIQHVPHV